MIRITVKSALKVSILQVDYLDHVPLFLNSTIFTQINLKNKHYCLKLFLEKIQIPKKIYFLNIVTKVTKSLSYKIKDNISE